MKIKLIPLILGFAILALAQYSEINLFSAYDATNTYTYNNDGATNPANADIIIKHPVDKLAVRAQVNTLASASIDIRVLCGVKNAADESDFTEVITKNITSATYPSNTWMAIIMEPCWSIAVGVKSNTNASGDSVNVKLIMQ